MVRLRHRKSKRATRQVSPSPSSSSNEYQSSIEIEVDCRSTSRAICITLLLGLIPVKRLLHYISLSQIERHQLSKASERVSKFQHYNHKAPYNAHSKDKLYTRERGTGSRSFTSSETMMYVEVIHFPRSHQWNTHGHHLNCHWGAISSVVVQVYISSSICDYPVFPCMIYDLSYVSWSARDSLRMSGRMLSTWREDGKKGVWQVNEP